MRLNFAFQFALAAAVFAAPAIAQEAVRENVIRVEAPTLSETTSGQTEWYRQFTSAQPQGARPQWQAEPTQDFSVTFGTGSRWQLNLDKVTRPGDSPLPREEMQAGATFNVTPRLSVGGDVRIGADQLNDGSRWENRDVEAGIRLKSAFKF